MKVLWLTIDRSARAMQIHDPLREAFALLPGIELTVVKRDCPNPVNKYVRRVMDGEIRMESILDPEYVNSFDVVYSDAFFAFTSEAWGQVRIPRAVLMMDQHGKLVDWYIHEAIRQRFEVLYSYRDNLRHYWPELRDSPYWLPVWFDERVFHHYDVEKGRQAVMTGVLDPNVYPLRTRADELLQGEDFYHQVDRPKETPEGDTEPRGERFAELLARARVSFVCASCYKYPVTKYVEIPAVGTCMVAEETPEVEAMGFIPYVHYIPLEPDAGGFVKHVRSWASGTNEAVDDISRAGYELVHDRHSRHTRAHQLLGLLDRIILAWRP